MAFNYKSPLHCIRPHCKPLGPSSWSTHTCARVHAPKRKKKLHAMILIHAMILQESGTWGQFSTSTHQDCLRIKHVTAQVPLYARSRTSQAYWHHKCNCMPNPLQIKHVSTNCWYNNMMHVKGEWKEIKVWFREKIRNQGQGQSILIEVDPKKIGHHLKVKCH